MKSYFLFALILIGFCNNSKAQTSEISQEEVRSNFESTESVNEYLVNKMLCKQWENEYVYIGQSKVQRPQKGDDFDIVFRTNGNFELIPGDGHRTIGQWYFNSDKKHIYLIAENNFNAKIKSIRTT